MAEADKIRYGIEYWRTKARERGGDVMVTQLDSMVTLLRECEHGELRQVDNHTVCFQCKWLRHTAAGEWEPVGFGR